MAKRKPDLTALVASARAPDRAIDARLAEDVFPSRADFVPSFTFHTESVGPAIRARWPSASWSVNSHGEARIVSGGEATEAVHATPALALCLAAVRLHEAETKRAKAA